MSEKTVTISVRVKASVRDRLTALAKERRRTVSQLASFAIEDWFEAGRDKTLKME